MQFCSPDHPSGSIGVFGPRGRRRRRTGGLAGILQRSPFVDERSEATTRRQEEPGHESTRRTPLRTPPRVSLGSESYQTSSSVSMGVIGCFDAFRHPVFPLGPSRSFAILSKSRKRIPLKPLIRLAFRTLLRARCNNFPEKKKGSGTGFRCVAHAWQEHGEVALPCKTEKRCEPVM